MRRCLPSCVTDNVPIGTWWVLKLHIKCLLSQLCQINYAPQCVAVTDYHYHDYTSQQLYGQSAYWGQRHKFPECLCLQHTMDKIPEPYMKVIELTWGSTIVFSVRLASQRQFLRQNSWALHTKTMQLERPKCTVLNNALQSRSWGNSTNYCSGMSRGAEAHKSVTITLS